MRLLCFTGFVVVAAAFIGSVSACGPRTCDADDDCDGGFVCQPSSQDPDIRQCSRPCAADLRCPAGEACVTRDDGSREGVCLQVQDNVPAGDACTDDRACASGACLGEPDLQVCVDTCDPFGAACATAGDRCTLDGLRHVCVPPLDDKPAGEQCTSPRECASGTCVLAPEEDAVAICADHCSDAVGCDDAALVCVRLVGGARACLEALSDGSECFSSSACAGGFCIQDVDGLTKCARECDAGSCAEGFACERDLEGNDLCMPSLDDKATGETCANARECVSGHCAHFATETQDLGTLCSDPCAEGGVCDEGLVCWSDDDPEGTDVCGPTPP